MYNNKFLKNLSQIVISIAQGGRKLSPSLTIAIVKNIRLRWDARCVANQKKKRNK